MGKLQRIGVIVVSIALILACAFQLLEYSTVPLITDIVEYLHSLFWFSIAACIVLIIVMLGTIALLIYAIKAPSNTTHLVIQRDGGNVDVSTTAIKSVIRHVVARHSLIKLESIRIQVKHANNPALKIKVRINPGRQVQLDELGLALQEEIADTVEKFCGGIVESVNIVFTSADNSSVGPSKSSFGSSSSKFTPVTETTAKPAGVATITVEDVKPTQSPDYTEETPKAALPSAGSTSETTSSDDTSVTYEVPSSQSSEDNTSSNTCSAITPVEDKNVTSLSGKVAKFFKRAGSSDTADN